MREYWKLMREYWKIWQEYWAIRTSYCSSLTRLSLEGRLLIAHVPSAYRSCPSSLLLVGRLLTTRDLLAYRMKFFIFENLLPCYHKPLEMPLYKAFSCYGSKSIYGSKLRFLPKMQQKGGCF